MTSDFSDLSDMEYIGVYMGTFVLWGLAEPGIKERAKPMAPDMLRTLTFEEVSRGARSSRFCNAFRMTQSSRDFLFDMVRNKLSKLLDIRLIRYLDVLRLWTEYVLK